MSLVHRGRNVRGELPVTRIIIVRVFAVDRRPEIAQPVPQRPSDLGQTLRPEHEKCDHEHEQQVRRLQKVPNHCEGG